MKSENWLILFANYNRKCREYKFNEMINNNTEIKNFITGFLDIFDEYAWEGYLNVNIREKQLVRLKEYVEENAGEKYALYTYINNELQKIYNPEESFVKTNEGNLYDCILWFRSIIGSDNK